MADGAGGDAHVPECVVAVQPARDGGGCHDDGVSVHDGVIGGDAEGVGGDIDVGNGLAEDLGPKPGRLRTATVHVSPEKYPLVPRYQVLHPLRLPHF